MGSCGSTVTGFASSIGAYAGNGNVALLVTAQGVQAASSDNYVSLVKVTDSGVVVDQLFAEVNSFYQAVQGITTVPVSAGTANITLS